MKIRFKYLLLIGMSLILGCSEKEIETTVIGNKVPLFKEPAYDDPIFYVEKNEKCTMGEGKINKDFMYFPIRCTTGKIGWTIYDECFEWQGRPVRRVACEM